MTKNDPSTERDPLDLLAEEFLKRRKSGEKVEVEQFADEHPDHAAALRDLLPTLLALDRVKQDRESTGGRNARVALPAMTRLGDFRIEREIGRGGMGVVFEAEQESLGRRVALKVLPQASLLTGNQLRRFEQEAQFAARLHHSNIVPVFGSGESDGYHWYAMQFIAGKGLDAWREDECERPLGASSEWRSRARFVAKVGEQVASALQYAHEQGTLHRDVKPANLLIDEAEHVWVTDFGLAKALEAEGLTQSGDMLGTLQYMAPEQFVGDYDARSEVYALGVTLHELLTLQPAYSGRTRSELMGAIRRGRPPSLRKVCPHVPDDLVVVIEKATAREPADRYQTAEALHQDLQAFLEDRPISARRQRVVVQILRWCRQNRLLATFAALALLALLGSGITGWVAYVVTSAETQRAENNLQLSLEKFGDVFDAIVGPDPLLLFEEDADTGEQSVLTLRAIDRHDVELLQKVLRFYFDFAEQNSQSQSLRFEAARAHRRIGVIHARLGQMDEAAKAYDQALGLYDLVRGRDVTREVAAVHVDYGQLEFLRLKPDRSGQRFEQALRLLDEASGDSPSKALRFDRANVHHLLARSESMAPRRRGPPSGLDRPSQRSGLSSWFRGRDPERLERARGHLDTSLGLVDSLLAEDPDHVEARLLKAECLLTSSRLRLGQGTEADPERTLALDLLRGLVNGRDVVAARKLLCLALSDSFARRWPGPSEQRTAELVEARGQANALVAKFPNEFEYEEIRARVGLELAQHWERESRRQSGQDRTAEQKEQLAKAESELRATSRRLLRRLESADVDEAQVWLSIGCAKDLDRLLRNSARSDEAGTLLVQFVSVLRTCLERLSRRDEKLRPPRPGAMPGDRARGMWGRGGSPEFLREIRQLREAGLLEIPPERGSRRGGPPREGRRRERER